MKGKVLFFTAALATLSSATAAPFVYPATWTSNKASDVKRGGILRAAKFGEYKSMNPFSDTEAESIPKLISGEATGGYALLKLLPGDLDYGPGMAESYTVSADKRTMTLKLRDGMKWSDGKPITSQDFLTTYKIHTDEAVGSDFIQMFTVADKIVKLSAPDAKTLVFGLPLPTADFVDTLAHFYPWPDHIFGPVYKAKGAAGIKEMWTLGSDPSKIVSAGPFTIKSYKIGERVELVKNPYFGDSNKDSAGQALPYIDGYTISIVKDQNAVKASFLAGTSDFAAITNSDDVVAIKRAVDSGALKATTRISYSGGTQTAYMGFNWNLASNPRLQGLFRNVNFRRAMSHLVNKAAMNDVVFGGLSQNGYSFLGPAWKSKWPSDLKKYDYDVAAATKLLAGLGYTKKDSQGRLVNSKGEWIEFNLTTNAGNTSREQMASMFAKSAKEAGVVVNFKPVDFNTLVGLINSQGDDRKFHAYLLGITMPYVAFTAFSDMTCGFTRQYNGSGKCLDPLETQTSNLLKKGQAEFDPVKRMQIVQDMVRIDSNNFLRGVYMVSLNAHAGWNNRVQGEYPANLMNPLIDNAATRQLPLTWIQ